MAEIVFDETRALDSNSMPQSPLPIGSKLKVRNEDEYLTTLPIDDTDKVENPSVETQLQNLDIDTEVLDSQDFADDLRAQLVDDTEKEVVMDSDDEGVSDEKEKSVRGHLRRRVSTIGAPSLEVYCPANGGINSSMLTCNDEPACVSHIGSQEPGESSQANALEFVDHYLSVNDANLYPEVRIGKADRVKSPLASSAKGFQNMARIVSIRTKVGESTFDWDDNQRDDGRDFFLKKRKDLILDCKSHESSSVSFPHLAGNLNIQKEKHVGERFEEKLEGPVVYSIKTYSRSKVKKSNLRTKVVQTAERTSDPHCVNELDEQFEPEIGRIERDEPDLLDVGFDTQMAAEAMEALLYAPPRNDDVNVHKVPKDVLEDTLTGATKKKTSKQFISPNRAYSESQITTRQLKEKRPSNKSSNVSTSFHKHSKDQKELYLELPVRKNVASGKSSTENCVNSRKPANAKKRVNKISLEVISGKKEEEDPEKENIKGCEKNLSFSKAVTCDSPGQIQQAVKKISPRHTRHWSSVHPVNRVEDVTCNFGSRNVMEVDVIKRRKRSDLSLGMKRKCPKLDSCTSGEATNRNVYQEGQNNSDVTATTSNLKLDTWTYPKRKRTRQNMRPHAKLASNFCASSTVVAGYHESEGNFRAACFSSSLKKNPRSDVLSNANAEASPLNSGENKQLRTKNSSRSLLTKELTILGFADSLPDFASKDLRRRRNKANIRVLFSQSLDDDIVKQQRKILDRLGISLASGSSDATHFITDRFVRTRNMLEAIALGKPVVTHLWLENCGQAKCFIDEKNYILRDAKKEKELAFSMPVSLARAREHPLLKDRRVFITPSVKPGKEMIVSLVKAVHGLVVEGIQGAAMDSKMSSDLLIISCEQDYAACVPFLEKGAAVYSLEILLNGIIIQKLEYERHQLFKDHVKVNCSTKSRKKDGDQHLHAARGR